MRLKDEDRKLIAACVHEIEARTEAEVVLVLREKSGSYRDVSYLVGACTAFLGLLVALFSPWEIHPSAIPMPTLALFWGAGWLCQRTPLRVWLTTAKRRREQVAKAARAAFFEKKVQETSGGTGVLVYFSLFEKDGAILADRAARAKLDQARIEEYRVQLAQAGSSKDVARALGTFLRSFGTYLGRALPWDEGRGAKQDELADEPDTEEEDG